MILGETLGINEGDRPMFGRRAQARRRASHGQLGEGGNEAGVPREHQICLGKVMGCRDARIISYRVADH